MLRIAIVNKFDYITQALKRVLLQHFKCNIIWTANTHEETLEKCLSAPPTLLILDISISHGAKAIQEIMKFSKCPILLTTDDMNLNNSEIFEAMGCGAIDAINLKDINFNDEFSLLQHFIKKINIIFQFLNIPDIKRYNDFVVANLIERSEFAASKILPCLVLMGASAGGPHAISSVISAFPSNAKFSVVIIQHMDESFIPGFVSWLNNYSKMPVEIACQGTQPNPGVIYVAGKNEHLIINQAKQFEYIKFEEEQIYAPSINVFFESVVNNWDIPGAAILLSGMGLDGANGLKKLYNKKWYTIAQNQNSCVVFGMPKNAINMGAVCDILPLDEIGSHLLSYLGY